MKRFIMLSFVLMAGIFVSEAQCRFTYEQGYAVGRDLGVSENYPDQNKAAVEATERDLASCTDYVLGVLEGYYLHKYSETSSNNEGGNSPTGSDDLFGDSGRDCTFVWRNGQWVSECN